MTKRANGTGENITRHANGDWWTRKTFPNGVRKAFYGKTQKEVRDKRDKYSADFHAGLISAGSEQKMSKYLASWLLSIKDAVRFTTYECYALNVRRVSPLIGHIKLSDLKASHIRECYERLQEKGLSGRPLSKRSMQQVHAVLHTALRQAVREEILLRNPCDSVTPPKPAHREMATLTLEEARAFLEATRDDRLYPLWVTLLLTGMRIGEAAALRWGDIDLNEATLSIQRTIHRKSGGGKEIGPVKSHRSNRRIELPGLVVEALRQHQDRERVRRRDVSRHAPVFTNVNGETLDAGNVRESLKRRLRAAGLPIIRTHDLRHTAASIHLQDNQHPKVVQELLGHSTFTLTMNTYSHLMPSMTRQAASRMDTLFRDTSTGG